MSWDERMESFPHTPLTHVCNEIGDVLAKYPERNIKAIVLLHATDTEDGEGGMMLTGYDRASTQDVLEDVIIHMNVLFKASGTKLSLVSTEGAMMLNVVDDDG